MKLFYGNIDFVQRFKLAGCSVTEVDFSRSRTVKEALKGLTSMKGVIILTNVQQIKINYERLISSTMVNTEAPFTIMGDLRFDFFRELKRSISTLFEVLSQNKASSRIVMTAGLIDEDFSILPVQPTILSDIKLFLPVFEEIVPFMDNG